MILSQRPNDDDNKNGFTRWPFMTTHTWAELSRGTWTLDIVMEPIIGVKTNIETGVFKEWTLVLHGTKTPPYANQPAGNYHFEEIISLRHELYIIHLVFLFYCCLLF